LGFQLTHEPRFSVDGFPTSDNDLATGHGLPSGEWDNAPRF
jgi:hypothetical protein